jgi:iron complex outermembrane receptor protein
MHPRKIRRPGGHSKQGRATYLGSAAIALVSSLPLLASAQSEEAGAARSGALEEIIVTAQFRAENVQDTPIAITALNAEMLERRGYQTVTDIAASAPNVTLKESYGIYSGTTAYIRGIGQFDANIALEPGVAIYLDDVYHPTVAGSNYSLLDLDRVEILRGPQGTLAGANSIGGAVKMYSKKPGEGEGGYIEAGYGSNDSYLVKGAVDMTLVEDSLFLRVSGGHLSVGGYVDMVDFVCAHPGQSGNLMRIAQKVSTCKYDEAGGSTTTAARAALRWLPTENLEINFSVDTNSMDQDAPPMVLSAITAISPLYNAEQVALHGIPFDQRFLPPKDSYITYATYNDLDRVGQAFSPNGYADTNGATLSIDYRLSDSLNLTSITSYRTSEVYGANDTDGSPLNGATESYYWDVETFTQELRLSGAIGALDWTIGGYYFDSDQKLEGLVNAQFIRAPLPIPGYPYGVDVLFFVTDDDAKREKKSAFANATYHVTDDFNVTLGLRYSDTKFDYLQTRHDPRGQDPFNPGVIKPQAALPVLGQAPIQSAERVDYRVALDYQITDGLMVYGQVATGFKDGGVNPTATSIATQTTFNEEELQSYELGIKSDLGSSVRLNAAVFYSDYTDLQLRVSMVDGTSPTTNVGEATIQGLEVEMEWAPTDALLLTASGSYIDFEFGDLGPAAGFPGGPCQECVSIYTPEYSGFLAAQYTFDLGARGTLTPQINGEYQSKVYTDATNREDGAIEGRWISNARLSWESASGDWKATFAINNLFDKYYFHQIRNALNNQGVASAAVGRPREAMFTLRKSF